jgi:hypothetical protein
MNLVGAAVGAADTFEEFLLTAATAHANGFTSIWGLAKNIGFVSGCVGAGVTAAAFVETRVDSDAETDSISQNAGFGFLGFLVAAYVTYAVRRDKMFQQFNDSSVLKFKLIVMSSFILLPAAYGASTTKESKTKAFKGWAIFGAILYALIGIVPVIIKEEVEERRVIQKLQVLFKNCYPWNETTPCPDEHGGFVKVWDGMIPDFVENAIGIKNNKERLSTIMDVLAAKQGLDVLRALSKTPLARIIALIVKSKKTK